MKFNDVNPEGAPRRCASCGKPILWKDYSGLATQSWHYGDSIIAQAVISIQDGEELETDLFPAEQRCGHCQAVLHASDYQ